MSKRLLSYLACPSTFSMIYEDDVVSFTLDKQVPCLVFTAKRLLASDEVKSCLVKSQELRLQLKAKYPYLNLLMDIRKAGAREVTDFEYYIQEHMAKAYESGLEKVAIVVPDDMYALVTYESFIGQVADSPIRHELFGTQAQARQWLRDAG